MAGNNREEYRLRQIAITKSSQGYSNYISTVSKDRRNWRLNHSTHPTTPDYSENQSTRAFDANMRKWRKLLHAWDDGDPTKSNSSQKNEAAKMPNHQKNNYNNGPEDSTSSNTRSLYSSAHSTNRTNNVPYHNRSQKDTYLGDGATSPGVSLYRSFNSKPSSSAWQSAPSYSRPSLSNNSFQHNTQSMVISPLPEMHNATSPLSSSLPFSPPYMPHLSTRPPIAAHTLSTFPTAVSVSPLIPPRVSPQTTSTNPSPPRAHSPTSNSELPQHGVSQNAAAAPKPTLFLPKNFRGVADDLRIRHDVLLESVKREEEGTSLTIVRERLFQFSEDRSQSICSAIEEKMESIWPGSGEEVLSIMLKEELLPERNISNREKVKTSHHTIPICTPIYDRLNV